MWLSREKYYDWYVMKNKIIGKLLAQRYIICECFGSKVEMMLNEKFLKISTDDLQ